MDVIRNNFGHPKYVFEQRHNKPAYQVKPLTAYSTDTVNHHIELDRDANGRLTRSAEQRLIKLAKQGDDQAGIQLVEDFTPLIYSLAADYRGRGVSFGDLVQSGYEGFQKALKSYDASYETRLVTWAYVWVKQEIERLVIGGAFVRMPNRRFRQFCEVKRRLEEGESIPSIAKAMGESTEMVQDLIELIPTVGSLDTAAGSNEDWSLHEVLPASDDTSENLCVYDEQSIALNRFLERLDVADRLIICMRTGIQGYQTHTLEQVYQALNEKHPRADGKQWNKEFVRVRQAKLVKQMRRWAENEERNVIEYANTQDEGFVSASELKPVTMFEQQPRVVQDQSPTSDPSINIPKLGR